MILQSYMVEKMPQKPEKESSQQRGYCMFCGGGDLSKEHMWSNWISNVIPKTGTEHSTFRIKTSLVDHSTMSVAPKFKESQGDVASKKLRVVCQTCNRTWMSAIEDQAKAVMAPLILGEQFELTPGGQNILTTWLTLKTMVAEFDDPEHAAISTEDHHWFHNNKCPLPDWNMWVGFYEGKDWKKRYRHSGFMTMTRGELQELKTPPPVKCNSQSSTFVVGNLFMQVHSTYIPQFRTFSFLDHLGILLYPILPASGRSIIWPSPLIITDAEAMAISNAFYATAMMGVRGNVATKQSA